MGQLDEAIRAHLELKRRHGASEEEVHAEEQEALGPVRREIGEPSPAAVVEPAESAETYAGDPAAEYAADPASPLAEPDFQEPPLHPQEDVSAGFPPEEFRDPVGSMEPPLDPPSDIAEPSLIGDQDPAGRIDRAEPSEPGPFGDLPDPADDGRFPAPGNGKEALGTEPAREGDTPAHGFEPVQEPEGEARAPEEEDVLEETPDFLQETPEHDRLWFEQKPPRDFDFDE